MEIWWYLEREMYNELLNFDPEEILFAFNNYKLFVKSKDIKAFEEEAQTIQSSYAKEKEKITKYQETEYSELVESNKKPTYDQEPTYMFGLLMSDTKEELLKLVKKYLDIELFINNKHFLPAYKNKYEEQTEEYQKFAYYLNVHTRTYKLFLSMVDYYFRRKHYFLSMNDSYKMCWEYSTAVNKINASKGIEQTYHYFLGSWGRVKKPFIDIDKISMKELILKYFKTNTKELVGLLEVIEENMPNGDDEGWEACKIEAANYIKKCEQKGLLKTL